MLIAILLGAIQGVTEWLPVSSEGIVVVTYVLFLERPLEEAVTYALWLHLGTALSALVVLRSEVKSVLRQLRRPSHGSSALLRFLFIATLVSAVVGFPALLVLGQLSRVIGTATMGFVGGLLLVTGYVQVRQRITGKRVQGEVAGADALIAGLAQGIAILPGLSRSGLTVATLLMRRFQQREALALSFLMSVPVSLGAAVFSGLQNALAFSAESLVAGGVAFLVGLATIRALITVAELINFGAFVLAVGGLILLAAVLQSLG